MKPFMRILTVSSFIFGSSLAFAVDSHPSAQSDNKPTKVKSSKLHKRNSKSSSLDQQMLAESQAEGGSLTSQKEIDEIRDMLGEK